jgi:hypothetical protein
MKVGTTDSSVVEIARSRADNRHLPVVALGAHRQHRDAYEA